MLKKKSFKLILPFVAVTTILPFFLIPSSAETTETSTSSTIISNTDILNYIDQYSLVVSDIKRELRINNYPVIVDYLISSDQKIELLIKTNEKVTKKTKGEISQITENTIKENKFDPLSFSITITNYDQPTQNTNTSTIRLSYNDLIGYIGEELFSKYDTALSLHYEFSSEKIKIVLNLPMNSQINNIEIKGVILDIIKQHNFNPDIFQIDITNNIKVD